LGFPPASEDPAPFPRRPAAASAATAAAAAAHTCERPLQGGTRGLSSKRRGTRVFGV